MNPADKFKRFKRLNWTTPSKAIPHGLSGIISILCGIYFISNTIIGNFDCYRQNLPLLLYSLSTISNAVAGLKLSHLAWVETVDIFKKCALLQICLVFYVLRFSPQYTDVLHELFTSNDSNLEGIGSACAYSVARFIDGLMALITVMCTLSFLEVSMNSYNQRNYAIAAAIFNGTIGIMLLSTYPIQLAFFGQSWWDCIQERYPMQNVGMIGCIYIPATVTFSLSLFGATLYQRKILSEVEFGLMTFAIISICVLGTVLSQEINIPDVSTQKIYLPCEEPAVGTWEYEMMKSMDFSRYARKVLSETLGIQFENELYSME